MARPLPRWIWKMTAASAVLALASLAVARSAAPSPPILATPDQIEAERLVIALDSDPAIDAIRRNAKAELAATSIGTTPDGAARIDEAIAQWTRSLIFKEIIAHRPTPALIWSTDDTPRRWLGHDLGGVGTSGDNPDFIYRSVWLDGSGRYALTGRFDKDHRPAQLIVSVANTASPLGPESRKANEPSGLLALLTDQQLHVAADGSFRITFGPDDPRDGSVHVATPPGGISVGIRDCLSDWAQRPTALSIRRLDTGPITPLDSADVRRRVFEKLPDYIRTWSSFPTRWLGGIKPNDFARPVPREGGWGFVAGIRFALKPDEAMLVTIARGGARYLGFQVIDPWMIAGNARIHQTSLNSAQVKPNADGSISYVIAPSDPGVANWLDTAGLHDGFGIVRWQVLDPAAKGDELLRDVRIIKRAAARTWPGIPLASPAERRNNIAIRAIGYANRTR